MKRLLLPLLASLALPAAVNAEVANYYLIARQRYVSTYVVPMDSLELCEEAGKNYINEKKWSKDIPMTGMAYICLKAK